MTPLNQYKRTSLGEVRPVIQLQEGFRRLSLKPLEWMMRSPCKFCRTPVEINLKTEAWLSQQSVEHAHVIKCLSQ